MGSLISSKPFKPPPTSPSTSTKDHCRNSSPYHVVVVGEDDLILMPPPFNLVRLEQVEVGRPLVERGSGPLQTRPTAVLPPLRPIDSETCSPKNRCAESPL